jgi:methylated-DNA-[protein]-cysteine S-methyltransferase
MARQSPPQIASFPTELGWMAMVATETMVKQIVFGYPSAAAATAALNAELADAAIAGDDWLWLGQRVQDFAAGRNASFGDVSIDLAHLTTFQRRVIKHCRAIPHGQTRSYGQLAALAGSPRAARAVGSTMAANRYSIVVPCHRVVNSDGSPGRYGGPGGSQLKRQLLALEQHTAAPVGLKRRARPKRTKSLAHR